MKIGIFDSGIGGLTVLHQAMHSLPDAEYIYYADVAHVPYGKKTKEQIISYSREITEFFKKQQVDAELIACNTASSCAANLLREEYDFPIVAMEPAVKPALHGGEEDATKRILVIATPVTLREEKLKNLIQREGGEERIDLLPMPDLVDFAEREDFDSVDVTRCLDENFAPYDFRDYSALVLGCTHFNYFKPLLHEKLGEGIELMDGNHGTVRQLAKVLNLTVSDADEKVEFHTVESMEERFSVQYYFSGEPVTADGELAHIMRLHNQLEKALEY